MESNLILPGLLKKGDTIAILAPSSGLGAIFPHRIENAAAALKEIGFNVKRYPSCSSILPDGSSMSAAERANEINQAFADKKVDAIIAAIGGLQANAILDLLDYKLIRANPKPFIGYSDITLIHHAIHCKSGVMTFYGPCAMTQFGEYPKPLGYTIEYFKKALMADAPFEVNASGSWTDELLNWAEKKDLERPRKMKKNVGHVWVREGSSTAPMVGGCLYSILQLRKTDFEIDYENKILFIETPEGQDFTKGEPLAYVDSQMQDLKNSHVFNKIKGLVVGRGFGYSEEEIKTFEGIVRKHTKDFNFPVLFNANIGHADPIITLPFGAKVTLDSEKNLFQISTRAGRAAASAPARSTQQRRIK
ncbi:LD-carboxypeptidase [Candidatus Woesearchaeota archaeon]|nr:LD-carboxypeptidase [Candidatus Woesearchaeota archaeon]